MKIGKDWMIGGVILLIIVAAGAYLLFGKGLREGSPLGDMINSFEQNKCGGDPNCIAQLRGNV